MMIKAVSTCVCAAAICAATCSGSEWIYWTDRSSVPPRIQRSHLDGSGVENIVTSGLLDPRGIAVDPFDSKIYWADSDMAKIQRADLNGSNVEDIVTGLLDPRGIALDIEAGKLYWADVNANKIQRANLDGSGVENIVDSGLVDPYYVAVSPIGGKVYWTDPGAGKIQSANLNGSSVEDLVLAAVGNTLRGIVVDQSHTKIYWADRNIDKIQRADVDGTDPEDLVTTGLDKPHGVALDAGGGRVYWTDTGTSKIQSSDLDGGNVSNIVSVGVTGPWGIALLLDDMDADSLPDQWEKLHFGGMTNSSGSPGDDWDGDGFIDLHEYVAGTDPTNSLSLFEVSAIETPATNVVISWANASGRSYTVYTSTNLRQGITNISGFVDVQGMTDSMSYTSSVSETRREFYRIGVKIAP